MGNNLTLTKSLADRSAALRADRLEGCSTDCREGCPEGCPSGQAVTKRTWICEHVNLATMHPELLEEWHHSIPANAYPANSSAQVNWRCRAGHTWLATIRSRVAGAPCPLCGESRGERRIRLYLEKRGIEYEAQKRFPDCRYQRPLPFDFYLPAYNLIIEYDGIQHSQPVAHFGGQEAYLLGLLRDKLKADYCEKQGITLLRIDYQQFDVIDEILEEALAERRERSSCTIL